MQVRWFSHLPTLAQNDFKKQVVGSKKVLDRLKDLCYNMSTVLDKTSEADFESSSWALKEAYRKGKRDQLKDIMDLVTVSDNE